MCHTSVANFKSGSKQNGGSESTMLQSARSAGWKCEKIKGQHRAYVACGGGERHDRNIRERLGVRVRTPNRLKYLGLHFGSIVWSVC